MPRFLTIWLPRWPVQRRLLARPELRRVPVFVCRRERRGAMTVVSWAWAEPPPDERRKRVVSGRSGRVAIPSGMSLAEAMAVLAMAHGSRACHVAEVEPDDPAADRESLERLAELRAKESLGPDWDQAAAVRATQADACWRGNR